MTQIKNQSKSFVADSTKKQLLDYFVFLGGVTNGTNSVDETDISLVSRITKDELCVVVPKNTWTQNSSYDPFFVDSSGINTYVLNDETYMVYLCVGKNQPTGLIGDTEYKSTIRPSHTNGIQTLSDGYSWLALYNIDYTLSKFLNSSVMPVNTLYGVRDDNIFGTYTTKYTSLCKSTPNNLGKCYFYYTKDEYDPITSTTKTKGSQVLGIPEEDWYCSVCHEFGEKLDYRSYHISDDDKQSTILREPLETIKTYTDGNLISRNNVNYIHQKNYEYILNLNHAINNLQLDVTDLTVEERIVSTSNPNIEFLDSRGFGAIAKITTYYDIIRNAFIANGIDFQNGGSDYVNPSFRVNGAASTKLNKAIKAILIDPIFIPDPSIILPTPRVSVVKEIVNEELKNTIGTYQTSFYKTGIVSDVQNVNNVNVSTGVIAGEKKDLKATTLLTLLPVYSPGGVVQNPQVQVSEQFIKNEGSGKIIILSDLEASELDYTSKITSLTLDPAGTLNHFLEIAGADELTFNVLSGASLINIAGVDYTISNVVDPPIKVDNTNFVVYKTLTKPINIKDSLKRQNSFTLNFLI